eukprot:EG_transcript_14122
MAGHCDLECVVIASAQQLAFLKPLLYAITVIGDPSTDLVYVFAAAYWLAATRHQMATALHLLAVAVTADYLNNVAKYLLRGERPFWMDDRFMQVDLTCETGYGNPSGHVMVTAAVWGFLCLRTHSPVLVAWSVLLLLLVGVSRVYLAAHYPHQVLLGLVVGGGLAYRQHRHAAARAPPASPTAVPLPAVAQPAAPWPQGPRPFLDVAYWVERGPTFTWAALSVAVALYICEFLMLGVLDLNPLGSLPKARAACKAGEKGLGATTTPFQGLARDVAFVGTLSILHAKMPMAKDGTSSQGSRSKYGVGAALTTGFAGLVALKLMSPWAAAPPSCRGWLNADVCDCVSSVVLYTGYATVIAVHKRSTSSWIGCGIGGCKSTD